MSEQNNLRKTFFKAGLGTAMRDLGLATSCRDAHSTMLKRSGWFYCPYCGEKLSIKVHCDNCDKDFMSIEAYRMHKERHKPTCPNCKSSRLSSARGIHALMPNMHFSKLPRWSCVVCGQLFCWDRNQGKAFKLTPKNTNDVVWEKPKNEGGV